MQPEGSSYKVRYDPFGEDVVKKRTNGRDGVVN